MIDVFIDKPADTPLGVMLTQDDDELVAVEALELPDLGEGDGLPAAVGARRAPSLPHLPPHCRLSVCACDRRLVLGQS